MRRLAVRDVVVRRTNRAGLGRQQRRLNGGTTYGSQDGVSGGGNSDGFLTKYDRFRNVVWESGSLERHRI